jgi:hypothetical protein
MKLKTILLLNENTDSWDGITEGNGWFAYFESNNWDNKRSGASVYITEGEPHKYWIKVKTSGLRKPNDTNESYRQRVRKHSSKVARNWISTARKLHNTPELNEVGNPIQLTWKECFKMALESVSSHVLEWGEESPKKKDRQPEVEPVNFSFVTEDTENTMAKTYGCVVLDPSSQTQLINTFRAQIPADWKVIAHHMTIQFPGFPEDQKQDLGKRVSLAAYELGISDKAIAVKVTGYPSKNSIPHITLAVNVNGGGKAQDSNSIRNWTKVTTVTLTGTVTEEKC